MLGGELRGGSVYVKTTWVRDSSGNPSVEFWFSGRAPVNLPVTLYPNAVGWQGTHGTIWTVSNGGANRLVGTHTLPGGTIELTCE